MGGSVLACTVCFILHVTNVLWTYGAIISGSGRGQASTFGHRDMLYTWPCVAGCNVILQLTYSVNERDVTST